MEEGILRAYKDCDMIFREGDAGDGMYIVKSGRVQISKKLHGVMVKIATLEDGEFFGEMALFNDKPRSATAMALGATVVTYLDRETFEKLIEKDPSFALKILHKVMERLRRVDEEVTRLIAQGLLPKDCAVNFNRYTWASTYD
jgi:CRP-like cAMP-binding protein